MSDAPSQMTGLTRASIVAGAVALAAWAWVFLATGVGEGVLIGALIASVVTIALGALARSESASASASEPGAAAWPRWMTVVGVLLMLLTGFVLVVYVVLSVGLSGPHH